ncbi:MAG: hypothetical protein A3I01_02440 [Betaproteobacteria bacterium RIFCSPLOWO2_02_FULL_65_24]|nr:MAG: hypothetical protein A3I01_02440 [Betaproteobacteria bacterium RIFCSPLOWO2_02_FULL_65_24]
MNGVRVLDCDMGSEDFRARVARSKFRDCPRFARVPEGHIVLQHHGTDAWFADIRIDIPGRKEADVRRRASE